MDCIILCLRVLLKMMLNIAPGIILVFGCIAITTEIKQDKRWLRKILNKYMLGVE